MSQKDNFENLFSNDDQQTPDKKTESQKTLRVPRVKKQPIDITEKLSIPKALTQEQEKKLSQIQELIEKAEVIDYILKRNTITARMIVMELLTNKSIRMNKEEIGKRVKNELHLLFERIQSKIDDINK